MQKTIAKYGLAAHLALLAVAPLFLFPYCGDETVAVVLLWLSLPAAAWTVLQPSVRRGEMLHDARNRVARELVRDPLFWVMLAIVVATGVRAINTGVAMSYNAEIAKWSISEAMMPLFPASCGNGGFLPFSASVACLVVVAACRHALGRAARQGYMLVSSTMAGAAAAVALYQANVGNSAALGAIACQMKDMSFVGTAFALHFLGGIAALSATIENKWNRAMPLSVLSVGGTAAGMLAFAPTYNACVFLAAGTVVFAYAFFHCMFAVKAAAEFKFVVFMAVCIVCGWMLETATVPGGAVNARVAALFSGDIFPTGYSAARKALSAVALKSWISQPWTGSGIGSFALDIRFNATPDDWAAIPRGLSASPFGWLTLLAERGIIGAAMFALPVLFMAFTFVRRVVTWAFTRTAPQPACWAGPIAFAAVAVSAFFDCSFMRADVLVAAGGFFALSASSFPKNGRGG